MKRMSIVGLCLISAFAMSLVAVTSASAAAPEFGRCASKAGGKYSDAGCTKKVTKGGKFEWSPGVVKKVFKAHQLSGTLATLETVGKIIAKFSGCETSKLECNSAGEPKGHITTFGLKGLLGKESSKGLEVQLTAEVPPLLAKFECSAVKVEVKGCVAHPVATNVMKLNSTEKFAATKGEQKPDKFLGGGTDECALESNSGKGFEEAGQTITAEVENEEAIEANAVV